VQKGGFKLRLEFLDSAKIANSPSRLRPRWAAQVVVNEVL